MFQHGPDSLAGPLRGTSAWWYGQTPNEPLNDSADSMDTGSPPPEPAPARRKRAPRKIRKDLVDRVRAEIAAGTYDTPDKFQAALERLLERMGE